MRRVTTALLCFAWLALAVPAAAGDKWTQPFDGVKQLHRTVASPKWSIHALIIDTTAAGVTLDATTTTQRKQKTSAFAKSIAAQVAVNGDFFSYATYATSGLAAGDGKAWADTADDQNDANVVFAKGTPAKPTLHVASEILKFDAKTMWGVVSGHPMLLVGGVVTAAATNPKSSFCQTRHPRTMVGLDKGGTVLIVAVVDGRQPWLSVGMKCGEQAALMKDLGAWTALNFDGGGSSTMYVAGQGVVNSPSDGSERTVANHLAIYAAKSGTMASISGKVHVAGQPTKVLAGASIQVTKGPTDTSDAKGLYELSMAAGTYTLTCTLSGYKVATVVKTLAKGQTLKHDFALEVSAVPTDIDGDGVVDAKDNCPKAKNATQADKDGDGIGDACDGDDDNDGAFDEDDNCPLVANKDQKDTDKDGVGDVCDPDDDGDGSADGADNCPLVANAAQADKDKDGVGDACDPVDDTPPPPVDNGKPDAGATGSDAGSTVADTAMVDAKPSDISKELPPPLKDSDGDGLADGIDNCPFLANADQKDGDADLQGDACDPDDDNDGEGDKDDNCPQIYNPDQTDSDGDGAGDKCDPTPLSLDDASVVGADAGQAADGAGGDAASVDVDAARAAGDGATGPAVADPGDSGTLFDAGQLGAGSPGGAGQLGTQAAAGAHGGCSGSAHGRGAPWLWLLALAALGWRRPRRTER